MKSVKEVCNISGVSVRTLHHYDAIGLLKPTRVTDAGYRLYDDTAMARLQAILLFRELQFPLKDIQKILDNPEFDPMEALESQIKLLELQRKHLDDLISHARKLQKTGGTYMNFKVFDTSEQEKYAAEAKAKWGKTDAYKEFEAKTAGKSQQEMRSTGDGLMDIFVEFGAIRNGDPASQDAQALVAKLQSYITQHYYTCTKQILQGLGMMYIAGDSMTENINKAGGDGTADFAHQAIEIFCK